MYYMQQHLHWLLVSLVEVGQPACQSDVDAAAVVVDCEMHAQI